MIAYILEIHFYLCIFLSEGSTIEFKKIILREYIFRSKNTTFLFIPHLPFYYKKSLFVFLLY